ncbi:MAG TPA: hypothetical protein VFT72_03875 [Opitutaceae bacterium]|nr:hypothetical protein [Opitutaceae bacterium]
MSLIHGIDRLILATKRLPWHVLIGILIGAAAAGFFSITYPLRGSSAMLFRLICVAPVAIAVLLLIQHPFRFAHLNSVHDDRDDETAPRPDARFQTFPREDSADFKR